MIIMMMIQRNYALLIQQSVHGSDKGGKLHIEKY